MKPLDVLESAARSLASSRRRTLLSLLAMSFGVAAVVVLTGLGEGARTFVRTQFDVMGTDVVAVLPGKVETTGGIPGFGGVPNDLTLADAEALWRAVPQAERVAPLLMGNAEVGHLERSRRALVFGSTPQIVPIRRFELRAGRFLSDEPWDRPAAEAVLGARLAAELFPGESPLGRRVRVGGWRLRVVGVLQAQGRRFGIDLDDTVVVPVATSMRLFDATSLFRVLLQLRPGADVERASERAREILVARHGEEDFTITTPDAILSSLEAILGVLTGALIGIAAISLGVAGLGIMNVMLVTVAERTPEVGLFKALGASRPQVLALFLAEAAMLGGLGGLLGIALGWAALAAAAAAVPALPAAPPAWAAGAALTVAVGAGAVFGLLPAVRAVRLDPVASLARKR